MVKSEISSFGSQNLVTLIFTKTKFCLPKRLFVNAGIPNAWCTFCQILVALDELEPPEKASVMLQNIVSMKSSIIFEPGRVAQSVTCLATDACLTADPGVASSIPVRSHTFVEIDHEIISTVILLPSADLFKKGCCQLQAKVCARITG